MAITLTGTYSCAVLLTLASDNPVTLTDTASAYPVAAR